MPTFGVPSQQYQLLTASTPANPRSWVSEAIALGRRVADCDIGWFEEPVVPEDLAGYA